MPSSQTATDLVASHQIATPLAWLHSSRLKLTWLLLTRLIDFYYTPRTTKLLGGYTGFTPSVRPSVRLSVRLSVRPSVRDDKATFLDLEEQIKDACIEVKTYDKRDALKFEIINYPDLSGNIPTKPAYGVFTSQVIRYARICSKKVDLLERVKSLTKKLLWKHYTINGLKSSLKKCLKKHRWITTKLGPRLHQNLTEE